MIEAVIFDMDGLLIDTEPLWQESEIRVFGKVGLQLNRALCAQTMGYKIEEVIKYWYNRQPWENPQFEWLEKEIFEETERLIKEKAEPMEGVNYIINFFEERNIRIGLASTSPMRIIKTVLNKLAIIDHFEVMHSAEFEEYGKPHPAVFINGAKKLNVLPYNCLVFEDSFNGLIAAKAARMATVAIPDKLYQQEVRFEIADFKLSSLKEFTQDHLDRLNR